MDSEIGFVITLQMTFAGYGLNIVTMPGLT